MSLRVDIWRGSYSNFPIARKSSAVKSDRGQIVNLVGFFVQRKLGHTPIKHKPITTLPNDYFKKSFLKVFVGERIGVKKTVLILTDE